MTYTVTESLTNFEFWSGAKDRVCHLTYSDLETLDEILDDGTEWTDTQINDLFWFEDDYIAELLGYPSWEVLEAVRDYKEVFWDTSNERMLTIDDIEKMRAEELDTATKEWDELDEEDKADYNNDIDEWLDENYEQLESIESFIYGKDIERCE